MYSSVLTTKDMVGVMVTKAADSTVLDNVCAGRVSLRGAGGDRKTDAWNFLTGTSSALQCT